MSSTTVTSPRPRRQHVNGVTALVLCTIENLVCSSERHNRVGWTTKSIHDARAGTVERVRINFFYVNQRCDGSIVKSLLNFL